MIERVFLMALMGLIFGTLTAIVCLIKKMPKSKILYYFFLVGYIVAVVTCTLLTNSAPRTYRRLQLIPFVDIVTSLARGNNLFLIQYVLNIALFIPSGILLHVKNFKFLKTLLYGFCFSLIIELLQYLFKLGSCDINDLIANTLGAILGWLVFLIFKRKSTNNSLK